MILVVGGQSRNIGKTALVAGLIRKFRSREWTALKITQYGHGVCSRAGEACGCEAEPEHPLALSEEFEPGTTDTGRFLAAGAKRSLWLRTPAGRIADASATLDKIVRRNGNVIIESNSVLDLIKPDLYLTVLDFGCEDFKPSALKHVDAADAYVLIDRGINAPLWEELARGKWDRAPKFLVKPPNYATTALCGFVKSRFSAEDVAR